MGIKKAVIAAGAAVLLGGCLNLGAGRPTPYLTPQQIVTTYAAYIHGPVSALFTRVGAPSNRVDTTQGHIYVWDGTATWRGGGESEELQCALQVFTDDADRIQNVVVKGQAGACQQFTL